MSDLSVWGKHKELHTTPELLNMRCDNYPSLSARKVDRSRLHPWKYYCEARHVNMELKDMYAVGKADCPLHRKLKPRRFK